MGRVIEILGRPDDFGIDVEIMIRKHHIPHHFPPEVLEQAQNFSNVIREDELAGRQDYRALDIVTIDGETARDFDDAVWVDRLPNGNYALQVHIADVSHYVKPGSPIDEEAFLRGTSVYFPDRAVPDAAAGAFHRDLLAQARTSIGWCFRWNSKSTGAATSWRSDLAGE